jgi:single-strand DNA-binding protein
MSARSLNKVLLIGNLTRDPELRYTPQGTAVATFGLATNRSWVPSDGGDRQEETEYHRIVAWAKLAEICSQLLYKGRKVFVEGRMQTRRFTGQDGNEREITEVVIDNMIALGAPKGNTTQFADDYEYGSEMNETAPVQPQAVAVPEPQAEVSEGVDDSKRKSRIKADEADIVDTDDIPF